MKSILIYTFVTLLTISSLYQINIDCASDFERWALKYGKKYYGDEKTYREVIYYQNKKMIEEHNSRNDVTYLMKENQFMTITNEEFINLYLSSKAPSELNDQNYVNKDPILNKQEEKKQFSEVIDWRGVVTVKNQRQCASSWAMAATSVVEAEYAINKQINVILSPQELMDCISHSDGCDDQSQFSQVDNALLYIYNEWVNTEQDYPYTGQYSVMCNKPKRGSWRINHFIQLESLEILRQLTIHPLSVKVDAALWQFYGSGVFSDCSSRSQDANYNAIVVGYDDWQNWWYVQASFGSYWGESGYIRLASGNTCGLKNKVYRVDVY